MDGYCTCGAKLQPDSLFCHRCGRPLRDDLPVVELPPPPQRQADELSTEAGPQISAPALSEISFHNGTAVRVGFLAATLVQLVVTLSAALGGSMLVPLILCAGGYYAVVLYHRRTGAGLTVVNGARIGWMTGLFSFVIMTVFFTLGMALLAGSDQLMKAYKESAAGLGLPPDAAQQIQKLMNDPAAFGLAILFGLVLQFFLLTVLCSVGGALGAKLRPQRKS